MPERFKGDKGEKGDKGDPGDEGARGPGSDEGWRGALNTILRSIGVGAGGGTFAGFITMVTDPTGYNAKAAGAVGVALGGMNGVAEIVMKYRRSQREADAEPNRLDAIAARAALEGCRGEKVELLRRLADYETQVRELQLNIQLYHRENQKLTADVVDLAKRLSLLDGRQTR